MSAALVELVAKGVQDVHLTSKPEVSFFRQTHKRHTNFAMTTSRLNPMGSGGLEHTIKIPNKGDLLSYIWIDLGDTATLAATAVDCDGTNGGAVFELWIGGQMVERQDAFYAVQLWHKFLVDSSAKTFAIQSDDNDLTVLDHITSAQWMPLHFFFCDSYYLPLVALQYAEVEIRIKYNFTTNVSDFKYYATYIVLDTDERAAFVDSEIDILIEQVQKISVSAGNRFDLNLLNHPVKCLMWGDPSDNILVASNVQIYLNGTELFNSPLPDKFFTQVQPYYHCEHASELLKGASGTGTNSGGGNLKMYSFALKVNKHQPCGTCNFSRLDNASIVFGGTINGTLYNLYAVNYNILRIKKGLAGVAYSN